MLLLFLKILMAFGEDLRMYILWDSDGLFEHNSRLGFIVNDVVKLGFGLIPYAVMIYLALRQARTVLVAIGGALLLFVADVLTLWVNYSSSDAQIGIAVMVLYGGSIVFLLILFAFLNLIRPNQVAGHG